MDERPEPRPNPYEDLEPEPPSGARDRARVPSVVRILARGISRRCPRCGSGGLFSGPFTIKRSCPRCGLRLEREEGGFLGAVTINYLVTVLVWIVLLIVWLVVDLPDVRVAPLTIASVALVALFPLLFFPFAKTTWTAIDYLVYRSSPDYASRDASERATGNGGRY